MRILGKSLFVARPFQNAGTSLYVAPGETVAYRNTRLFGGSQLQGESFPFGTSIPKTARVAVVADPAAVINWPVPPELAGQTITADLRTCKDDVESDMDNSGAATILLDGSGDPVATIDSGVAFLSTRQLTGGLMLFRFAWYPGTGMLPDTLALVRTAGPTSPATVGVPAPQDPGTVEITTEALDDSAPYTFKLTAVAGDLETDLVTGIVVQADSSGPPAPTVTAGNW